ncbi:hypothetical protein [Streptomyces sp. NPDC055006]
MDDQRALHPCTAHIVIVHRPDHDVTVALVLRAMTLEPDPPTRMLVAAALIEETGELFRRRTIT